MTKFYDSKLIRDSMYCEDKVNDSNLWNKGLHDVLELEPIIVLIILFCNRKTFLLSIEIPQNIIPYFITAWKYAKYTILRVNMLM